MKLELFIPNGGQGLKPLFLFFNSDFYLQFPFGFGGIFVLLAFIGFFRSAVEKVKPDFILDQKKIQDEWHSRNSVTSILLPIMAFFIFIFNAVAWAVYGLISIVEFITFLFKALWWLISWIWNELIHPVIFLSIKLLWHYLIIWSWRFFKISFSRIPEAYSKSTLKNGFISSFVLAFIFFFFYYLSSILQQQWILIFMIVGLVFAILFFAGFTLYNDEKRSFSSYWTNDMMSQLGIMVIISVISSLSILILNIFTNTSLQIPIHGIAFPIVQILMLVFVIAFISSMVSNAILPAYMASTKGNFEAKDFLLNIWRRLPRLVGAVPFVIFGGLIASIATIIVGLFLWWSTNSIKASFCDNAVENMTSELYTANTGYNDFFDSVNNIDDVGNYPNKKIKRIAKLKGRIYTLGLVKNSWGDILLNLPSGIRDSDKEKENYEIFRTHYFKQDTIITDDIAERELILIDLNSELKINPENLEVVERIDDQVEQINYLKHRRKQLEAQFSLSTKLSKATVRSIKASNFTWIVGTFFAIFGFALLAAIVLTPFWILRTKVYFDLYEYHHEGKSYFKEQVEYYKNKNENQPLLGLYVFIVIGVALSWLLYFSFVN